MSSLIVGFLIILVVISFMVFISKKFQIPFECVAVLVIMIPPGVVMFVMALLAFCKIIGGVVLKLFN